MVAGPRAPFQPSTKTYSQSTTNTSLSILPTIYPTTVAKVIKQQPSYQNATASSSNSRSCKAILSKGNEGDTKEYNSKVDQQRHHRIVSSVAGTRKFSPPTSKMHTPPASKKNSPDTSPPFIGSSFVAVGMPTLDLTGNKVSSPEPVVKKLSQNNSAKPVSKYICTPERWMDGLMKITSVVVTSLNVKNEKESKEKQSLEFDTKSAIDNYYEFESVNVELFESFKTAKSPSIYYRQFFQKMPKADQHTHTEGAIEYQKLLSIAMKVGLYWDTIKQLFVSKENMKEDKPNETEEKKSKESGPAKKSATSSSKRYILTSDLMKPEFTEEANRIRALMSMNGCDKDSQLRGRDHFFKACSIAQSIIDQGKVPYVELLSHILDKSTKENQFYKELMNELLPDESKVPKEFFPLMKNEKYDEAYKILIDSEWLSDYVTEKSTMLLKCNDSVYKTLSQEHIPENITKASYIIELMRDLPPDRLFVHAVAAWALARKYPTLVLAINLVGPEDQLSSMTNFISQMDILKYVREMFIKSGYTPNMTLHAGEGVSGHIMKSIEAGAIRLGHAVSLPKDVSKILYEMKARGVVIEICLRSNRNILQIFGKDHPIHFYLAHGVAVTINTDDEGINLSSLTDEMMDLMETCPNLGYLNIKQIVRNSIRYSFLPGETIYDKCEKLNKNDDKSGIDANKYDLKQEFKGCHHPHWKSSSNLQDFINNSSKAQQEIRLERFLAKFEAENAKACLT